MRLCPNFEREVNLHRAATERRSLQHVPSFWAEELRAGRKKRSLPKSPS